MIYNCNTGPNQKSLSVHEGTFKSQKTLSAYWSDKLANTYDLSLEDVQQARQVLVLAGYLVQVDHLEVRANAWTLALASKHAPPLLLVLHEHGDLAGGGKRS